MIRGSSFEWVLAGEIEIGLPAARVRAFDFNWGAQQGHRRVPGHFHAYGRLELNEALDELELEQYERLRVSAGGVRYFDLAINDFTVHRQKRTTVLILNSVASLNRDKEVEYVFAPRPDDPNSLITDLTSDDLTLTTVPGAPLRQIVVTAHGNPERSQFRGSDTIRRIIRLIESSGWTFALEDIRSEGAAWKLLPAPLTARADRRPVGRRYGTHNDIVVGDSLRKSRSRHWRADEYVAQLAGDPFQKESQNFRNLTVRSRYDGDFPYFLGRSRDRRLRVYAWDSTIASSFAGFTDVEVTGRFQNGREAHFPVHTYIAPDGSYAAVIADSGEPAQLTGRISWVEWRDSFGATTQSILATGVEASELRTIQGKSLILWDNDTNANELQALIDEWRDYEADYGSLEFVIEDLAEESPARVLPGDRVQLRVGDYRNVAVVIGMRWALRGNKPLRVTWDVLTQGAIPEKRMYLGGNTKPLYLGDESHPVWLGV